jgi:hypothetical protein
MKINISQVFTPSPNQTAKGILGTANLAILDDEGNPVAYLNGMTVRRTKDGKNRFLSMPSYAIKKEGETQYRNHFALFPSGKEDSSRQAQRARMDSLTNDVLRILDNGGTHKKDFGNAPTAANPTPPPVPPAAEPWESPVV